MYNVKQYRLGINEIFVAKYQHNLQNSIQSHKDGSEFSFIIALMIVKNIKVVELILLI
jgi:hypothetical protein